MGVLDPTEYVPGEDDYGYIPQAPVNPAFATQGPGLAAQGNMGALQQLAQGPMMDQQTAAQLRERMMARVRSPEQMDQAVQQRRGALNQLNQEILSPNEKQGSFFTNMMMNRALAQGGKGMDWNNAMTYGIGAAMQDNMKRGDTEKQSRIAAAKNLFDFEGIEDKAADSAESKAMGELSKIAAAQARGNAKVGAGVKPVIKIVPNVGAVDFSVVDPQTGRPVPKVLLSSDNTSKLFEGFVKQAQIIANSPQMEGQFKDGNELMTWVRDQAMTSLKGALKAKGAPAELMEALPGMINIGGGTPQAGAQRPSLATPGIVPDGTGAQKASLDPIAPEEQQRRDAQAIEMLQATINSPDARPEDKEFAAKDLAALQTLRGGAAKTAQVQAPTAPAAPAGGLNPGLSTKATREGQAESARQLEKSGADVLKQWMGDRSAADKQEASVDNIMMLRPQMKPGMTAEARKQVGAALNAIGFKGGISDEAEVLQSVTKLIREQTNELLRAEKGVQTQGDEIRVMEEYAKIKDTPYAFDFAMGIAKESAQRKKIRAQIGEESVVNNKSHANMQKNWETYKASNLGPMVTNIKGAPVFRHQFIKHAMEANKDSGLPPEEIEQQAAAEWVRRYGGKK